MGIYLCYVFCLSLAYVCSLHILLVVYILWNIMIYKDPIQIFTGHSINKKIMGALWKTFPRLLQLQYLQTCRWKQYVPPKLLYVLTSTHVRTQKSNITTVLQLLKNKNTCYLCNTIQQYLWQFNISKLVLSYSSFYRGATYEKFDFCFTACFFVSTELEAIKSSVFWFIG